MTQRGKAGDDELLRMRHGQAAHDDGVDEGEDGRVRADSDREHGDSERSEPRRAADRPYGHPEVGREVLDPPSAASVAHAILRLLDAAERKGAQAPRFISADTGALLLLGLHLEMKAQLFV